MIWIKSDSESSTTSLWADLVKVLFSSPVVWGGWRSLWPPHKSRSPLDTLSPDCPASALPGNSLPVGHEALMPGLPQTYWGRLQMMKRPRVNIRQTHEWVSGLTCKHGWETHDTQLISQTVFKISTLTWWKPKAHWDGEQRQDHVAELHSVQVVLHDVFASGSKSVTHRLWSGHTDSRLHNTVWLKGLFKPPADGATDTETEEQPSFTSFMPWVRFHTRADIISTKQTVTWDQTRHKYSTVTFKLALKTKRNAHQYFNAFILLCVNNLVLIQHKLLSFNRW